MVKKKFNIPSFGNGAFFKLEKDFKSYLSNKKPKKGTKKSKSSSEKSINRKDFETFRFGVQRLKELEKELDSMDTRGFSKEANSIKSKLKNVSDIPLIEKEIKTLKLKIDKKYKPQKKRKSSVKKELNEIKEDIKEISKRRPRSNSSSVKKELSEIKEEISKVPSRKELGEIKEQISKVPSVRRDLQNINYKIEELSRRRPRSNSFKFEKELTEIRKTMEEIGNRKPTTSPEIKKELSEINYKIEELSRRRPRSNSSKFEKELSKVREIIEEIGNRKPTTSPEIKRELKDIRNEISKVPSVKKELNEIKEEVEEFPMLKKDIEDLGKKIKEIGQRRSIRIDPDIDVLVDGNFSDFLVDVKSALSERVRRREKEVQDVLSRDLLIREQKFKKKYLDLIEDFNERKRDLEKRFKERYELDVKINLKNRISQEFDKLVQEKLRKEKENLEKNFNQKLKNAKEEIVANETEKIRKKIEKEFDEKLMHEKEVLKKEYAQKMKEQVQSKLDKERESLRMKMEKDFDIRLNKRIKEYEEQMQERLKQVLS